MLVSKGRLALRRIERFLKSSLRLHSNKPFNNFATLEDHQGRNAAHAIALSRAGAVVDVDLANLYRARVLRGQLLDDRSNHAARPAPRSPEVHQYGLRGLQ